MEIGEEVPSEKLKKFACDGFLQHSVETLVYNGDVSLFAFTCREGENLLGLVMGKSSYGGLHIKYLIVCRSFRKQGLGTTLMERAISRGKELGCQFIHLETMNFQALGFYQKLGFELEYTRQGYRREVSMHYLRKNL